MRINMKVEIINYEKLKLLKYNDYAYIVFGNIGEDYDKDIKALTKFLKDCKAVSEENNFDEMYIFEHENKRNLIVSLEKDENKETNLPFVQFVLLMNGIEMYWLSDYISHLDYLNINESDIKI